MEHVSIQAAVVITQPHLRMMGGLTVKNLVTSGQAGKVRELFPQRTGLTQLDQYQNGSVSLLKCVHKVANGIYALV